MNSCLEALELVKNDLLCDICNELCIAPKTFFKCAHTLCGEHVIELDTFIVCPLCGVSHQKSHTMNDSDVVTATECILNLESLTKSLQLQNKPIVNTSEKTLDKLPQDEVRLSSRRIKRLKKDIEAEKSPEKAVSSKVSTISDKSSKKKSPVLLIKVDKFEGINTRRMHATKSTVEPVNQNEAKENVGKPQRINSNVSAKTGANKAVEKRNKKGETPLHVACIAGKLDRVLELLEAGSNPNTKDNAGWTPLHEVVVKGNIHIARVLLEHGALSDTPGCYNETPLHEAVRYDNADISKLLVQHGADLNARNSKGETALDLASAELKDLLLNLEVQQTQSANILNISSLQMQMELEDMHVYAPSISSKLKSKLDSLSKSHSNIKVETKSTKKVTHLIVETFEPLTAHMTLDILSGIVNGLWIISQDWIEASSDECLAPCEDFEIAGSDTPGANGARKSRFNKYKQLPRLFNGCHIYLQGFGHTKRVITKWLSLQKQDLSKIIVDGGGVLLRREPDPEGIPEDERTIPYHAKKDGKLSKCSHFIIYSNMFEPMYDMSHLKALSIGWLLECIARFELCEPW